MRIIEQAITGKKNQEECEDGIEVNERFIAVIDGSTSKSTMNVMPGMSNGRFCMETVRKYISTMPGDTCMEDFCTGITEKISSIYNELGIDIEMLKNCPTERPTASAVIYSMHYGQVWMVGDCQCMVDGVYYDNPKPQEKILSEERSKFLNMLITDGTSVEEVQTNDPGREHILDALKESCKWQNVTYPVIDGFSIPVELVKKIETANCAREIILASDGYPFLKKTLEESERALAKQLAEDPLCINTFKATKGLMKGKRSFDDRCYIRFNP